MSASPKFSTKFLLKTIVFSVFLFFCCATICMESTLCCRKTIDNIIDLPLESFFEIVKRASLQSMGRLKQVCRNFEQSIDMTDNEKLSCWLVQDYDQCTDALISCAHKDNKELFEILMIKQNQTELKKRNADIRYMGWNKDNLTLDEQMNAFKGVCNNEYPQDILRWSMRGQKISRIKMLLSSKTVKVTKESLKRLLLEGYPVVIHDRFMHVIKILSLLVSHGISLNMPLSKNGKTLLMQIGDYGNNIEIIKFLLCNGANLNAVRNDGLSVLHVACNKLRVNKVRLLLENGADLSIQDHNGNTPLHSVMIDKHSLLIQEQLFSPLGSLLQGNIDATLAIEQLLIDKSTSNHVNIQNNNRLSLLHMTQSPDIIALLLSKGASINLQDINGHTPLHKAILSHNFGLTKYLLANGAVVLSMDGFDYTHLYIADEFNMTNILKHLFANMNAQDDNGETITHKAAKAGNLGAVHLLMVKGADLSLKDNNGHSVVNNLKNLKGLSLEDKEDLMYMLQQAKLTLFLTAAKKLFYTIAIAIGMAGLGYVAFKYLAITKKYL